MDTEEDSGVPNNPPPDVEIVLDCPNNPVPEVEDAALTCPNNPEAVVVGCPNNPALELVAGCPKSPDPVVVVCLLKLPDPVVVVCCPNKDVAMADVVEDCPNAPLPEVKGLPSKPASVLE